MANAESVPWASIMLETTTRPALLVQMDKYEAQMAEPMETAPWLPTMALASYGNSLRMADVENVRSASTMLMTGRLARLARLALYEA
jgi:hypothetical protein